MIIFDHEKPESTGSAQESAEVQTHCALCGREFSEHAAHWIHGKAFCDQCASAINHILRYNSNIGRTDASSNSVQFASAFIDNTSYINLIYIYETTWGQHKAFEVALSKYGAQTTPPTCTVFKENLLHSISHGEFLSAMQGWKSLLPEAQADDVIENMWRILSRMSLRPTDGGGNNSPQFVIPFDWALDGFSYGEKVWGKQHTYFVSYPLSDGSRIVREYDTKIIAGEMVLDELSAIGSYDDIPSTEQEARAYFSKWFSTLKFNKFARQIPLEVIDHGTYGHKSSSIIVNPPDLEKKTCFIQLYTYEAELAPYPQGYFEGYTFKKDFYTDMEEYNWSNDQLKDKYGPAFPSKR